jgi:hypothetical protein
MEHLEQIVLEQPMSPRLEGNVLKRDRMAKGLRILSSVSRRSSARVGTSMARVQVNFHSRPGSRVWISWSSQQFPSGSSNEANEK